MTIPTQLTAMPLDGIRAVMFDMDGVIYRGTQALPGVNELLAFLLKHDIGYACITNNASRTQEQFAERLHQMGISVPAERIITSSLATSIWLRSQAPRGTTVFAIGMDGLRSALFGDGYFVEQPQNPEYVVVGADFEMTYESLKQLVWRSGLVPSSSEPIPTRRSRAKKVLSPALARSFSLSKLQRHEKQ